MHSVVNHLTIGNNTLGRELGERNVDVAARKRQEENQEHVAPAEADLFVGIFNRTNFQDGDQQRDDKQKDND